MKRAGTLRFKIKSLADNTAISYLRSVTIKLWDYNENCLKTATINANGNYYKSSNIKIVSGQTYYFKYTLAKGTSSNLKISMTIRTWK